MIQTKQTYEAPEAVALVVRFEGVVCTSFGSQGIEKGNDRSGEDEGFYFG